MYFIRWEVAVQHPHSRFQLHDFLESTKLWSSKKTRGWLEWRWGEWTILCSISLSKAMQCRSPRVRTKTGHRAQGAGLSIWVQGLKQIRDLGQGVGECATGMGVRKAGMWGNPWAEAKSSFSLCLFSLHVSVSFLSLCLFLCSSLPSSPLFPSLLSPFSKIIFFLSFFENFMEHILITGVVWIKMAP